MIPLAFVSLAAATAPSGTATIPVGDLLALNAQAPGPSPAPIDGVVDRLVLTGRVLDDALDVDIEVHASVLAADRWTRLPLLEVTPELALDPAPPLDGAWLAVEDGTLVLVAKEPGRHGFTLSATVQPTRRGSGRTARVGIARTTATRLDLSYDPELVALDGRPGSGRATLRPDGSTYTVSWTATRPARPIAEEGPTPGREPFVDAAWSSIVSTLEGTWLVRTQYALSFSGRPTVSLSWPEHQALRRVYVNGRPVPAEPVGHTLELEVSPAREGGDTGVVELVLEGDPTGYLLQGTLDVALPTISWPVREWVCDTHLPDVFVYSREGGSMQTAIAASHPSVDWAYPLPTPGRAARWSQQLVLSTAPTLRLDYTVDLDGAYFRP